MSVLAMLSLGFLGMVSTGFDGSGQIPIGDASSFGAAGIYAFPLEPQVSTAPAGITFPNFKPSEFPFVTTVPDDGTDKGGGWQVAKVKLEFVRIVIPTDVKVWHCAFKIEMPLRTEFMGKVDAKRAASFSAEITNLAALDMDYKLPEGIFCRQYMSAVDATFKTKYPKLGAKAGP